MKLKTNSITFFPLTIFIFLIVVAFIACEKPETGRELGNPNGPETGANTCEFTDSTISSPHYISNAPEGININLLNINGVEMRISGTVFGGDNGERPLTNAKIEVWHPNEEGEYEPDASGDIADFQTNEINLRGTILTDPEGVYNFISIQPGLNENDDRRRHIYYRITAPGHKTLVTQSYWKSEKGNTRDFLDSVDENPEPCRYLDFQDNSNAGGIIASFDIYLEKE